jgi:hypothetical protein
MNGAYQEEMSVQMARRGKQRGASGGDHKAMRSRHCQEMLCGLFVNVDANSPDWVSMRIRCPKSD